MDNLSKYYKPSDYNTHEVIWKEAQKFMWQNCLMVRGYKSIVFFPEKDFSDYLFDDTEIKQFDSFLLRILELDQIDSIEYEMVILQNIEPSKFRFTRFTHDFRQWTKLDKETKLPQKALALCHASVVKPATTFLKRINFGNMENDIEQQSVDLELRKKVDGLPICIEINKTEGDWYSVQVFIGKWERLSLQYKRSQFLCDGLKGVFKLIESFML